MAVTGTNTNFVKLTAAGDLFPATAKLQSAVGGPGAAPMDYPGLNLAGIVIRKSSGVVGGITIQEGRYSGLTLVYNDILPYTQFGTNVGLEDFWHMPEGAGAMCPQQIKLASATNMSIVLFKR